LSQHPQIVVTKQDGTVERFDETKLANCLARVLGELSYDARIGRPLARAIAMHLEHWSAAEPPSTAYIRQCVCAVLEQTGLSDVAAALTAHWRHRRRLRQRLQILEAGATNGAASGWRKAALVETLQQRYGLGQAVSRYLAGRIESQVFALGYRQVSTTLVSELTRNEVAAWGLAEAKAWPMPRTDCSPPVATPRPEKED